MQTPVHIEMRPLPALADAFAAILAAEQADPDASASLWPAAAPSAAPPAAAVTDQLIENVTSRVLERLSDTVVFRDAVAEATSTIAERLIREEIERIKSSIT